MTFVDVGAIRRRTERLTSSRRFGRRSAKKRRERSPLSPFCQYSSTAALAVASFFAIITNVVCVYLCLFFEKKGRFGTFFAI